MNIRWLGQGGFLFEAGGTRLIVDPYLTDVLADKGFKREIPIPIKPEELGADYIVCTHDHGDHFDPDTVVPATQSCPKTVVIGPGSVVRHGEKLGLAVELLSPDGAGMTCGAFSLQAVSAFHSDPGAIGLLLTADHYQVYLTADTTFDESLVSNALNYGPVDLLLICVNGKLGNMDAQDALKIASGIKPRLSIPMHYGMFANNTVDPEVFLKPAKEAGIKSKNLDVGIEYEISELLDEQVKNVPFRGVVPPVITPLMNDETLDKEAFCKLIDKLVNADCSALFICGTAGIGPALTDEQYTRVLQTAIKAAPGHIPLLAGVMEPSTARAIHRLRLAEKIGYKYAVLSVPYFFVPRSDREIMTHFGECARATSMNIIAYNLPQYTRCNIPVEILLAMHRRGWIGGIKESSGDREFFSRLCLKGNEAGLPVFQGNRPVFAELSELHASGIVPVPANVDPELYVKAWKEKTETLQEETDKLWFSLVNGSDFLSGSLKKLADEGIGVGRLPRPLL